MNMSALSSYFRPFSVFFDPYYWKTAVLIAHSSLTRQYRNSFLGMLWTLFQPLSMVLVYSAIMPMILHMPMQNYGLYVLCTLPLWGLISSSLIVASGSLISQGETLKRCMISSTAFPLADVFRSAYTYAIAFFAMYGAALLIGFPVSWHALLWPVYFIPVLISIAALCIGVAFVAPYVRDIGEAISVGMNMLIWFTAVVYPIEAVPAWVQEILVWNPFYILIHPAVSLIYSHELPSLGMHIKLFGVMAMCIVFGYSLYRLCRRNFVYYL